jgi:hypothetical protein
MIPRVGISGTDLDHERRAASAISSASLLIGLTAVSDPLPPDTTYRSPPTRTLSEVKADDEAQKSRVMGRQTDLLNHAMI